jgi:hypothetical protein
VVRLVVTSPLSLARVLWWYGEDGLWPRALTLRPTEVADLAPRFAELLAQPLLVADLWPCPPRHDAHLVLGTIEHLEERLRPAARRHRRSGPMPDELDLSEEARWADPVLAAVLLLVDLRTERVEARDPASLRPRVHGRWAPA